MMEDYLDIKTKKIVYIREDYPYRNIPELPLCEELVVNNSNIEIIDRQPNCKRLVVNSCLINPSNRKQYNIGHLKNIDDLPLCEDLSIHAASLKKIGYIDNCKKLKICNESETQTEIAFSPRLSILIKNDKGDIKYSGFDGMTLKETFRHLLKDHNNLSDFSLKNTQRLEQDDEAIPFDLSYLDFSDHTLENITFYNTDFTGCNFEKANLINVMFEDCNFDATNLSHIDLTKTHFKECLTENVNFDYCRMTKDMTYILDESTVNINTITILPTSHNKYNISFQHNDQTLESPIFQLFKNNGRPIILPFNIPDIKYYILELINQKHTLEDINLGSTKCYPSQEEALDLQYLNFKGCKLKDIVFENCDLSYSIFEGVTFANIKFINCNLDGTNFSNSDLTQTYFLGCNVESALYQNCIILPELAGQIKCYGYKERILFCDVEMQNEDKISFNEYANRPHNPSLFGNLWSNNIYVLSYGNERQLILAGNEIECYRWFGTQKQELGESYHVTSLTSYLRKIISQEKLVTDSLNKIFSFIKDIPERVHILDIQLSNLLRKGKMIFGSDQDILNLCNAITSINKESMGLYQANCQVNKQRIRINTDNYLKRNPQLPPSKNKLSL